MTLQKLASAIAKREGKKSQARIGDIREILKLICVMDIEDAATVGEDDGPITSLIQRRNEMLIKRSKRKAKGAGK